VSSPDKACAPELSDETFALFQQLILREMGIRMRASKKILVANRLRRRLAALKLPSYEKYYLYLTRGEQAEEEIPNFVGAISTNETYFYRGENQFAALREQVLPRLLASPARRQGPKRLSIWSAGASSGEEPYTIYMVAEEALRALHWAGELGIVATDISRDMIATAKQGEYSGRSFRALPARFLEAYFDNLGGGRYRVQERVKAHVHFQVHNLMKDAPPGKCFDLIFCRNVLIYFDRATQTRLVDEKFAPALAPDGFLFIGNSESLLGGSRRFKYAQLYRCPIYRLAEEPAGEARE
jgi:chemotaxis protein methyltransferase CheR